MLRDIEHRHHDIEGVGDQSHGDKGLEDPFEKDPGFKVGQVIMVDDQLNQLITHDEGQDNTCYRDDD